MRKFNFFLFCLIGRISTNAVKRETDAESKPRKGKNYENDGNYGPIYDYGAADPWNNPDYHWVAYQYDYSQWDYSSIVDNEYNDDSKIFSIDTDIMTFDIGSSSEAMSNFTNIENIVDMAENLINNVFRPFSDFEDIFARALDEPGYLAANYMELVNMEKGFLACMVLGGLFAILFPVFGAIALCCCCKKKKGKKDDGAPFISTILLIAVSLIMMVGVGFVLSTNNFIGVVIKQLRPTTIENFESVNQYFDSFLQQFDGVRTEFGSVQESIMLKLAYMPDQIGGPMQDELREFMEPVYADMNDLEDNMDDLSTEIDNLVRLIDDTSEKVRDVEENKLEGVKDGVREACYVDMNPCNQIKELADGLTLGIDFNQLDSSKQQLNELRTKLDENDFQTIKNKGNDLIASIPDIITEEIEKVQISLRNDTFPAIETTIDDHLGMIPIQSINEQFNFTDYEGSLIDYVSQLEGFEKFRKNAGMAFISPVFVVVVCNAIGLVFVFCCDKDSCLTKLFWGLGNILTLLFASALMIMVMITFAVGGHLERYLCQTLQMGVSDTPYEGLKFFENQPRFQKLLSIEFGNITLDLVPSEILESCADNKGLYEVLDLAGKIDIDALLDVSSYIEIVQEQFGDVEHTFAETLHDLEFMDNQGLQDFQTQDDQELTNFITEIKTKLEERPLQEFPQRLRELASEIPEIPQYEDMREGLREQAEVVEQIQAVDLGHILYGLNDIGNRVDNLRDARHRIEGDLEALREKVTNQKSAMVQNAPKELRKRLRDTVKDFIAPINTFIDWVAVQIKEKLGACKPVHDIYTSLMDVTCSYFVKLLNAFWFSVGWATAFLLPSFIISAKY